jgi:hypothetical protein
MGAFAMPLAMFLAATLPNLSLPGIQYDEVYYVPPAAALLKQQPDAEYVMIDPSVIRVFGRPLPLMFNYYTSFFRAYLTLPVFALFGISVESIRGASIALGAIALLFCIAFVRHLVENRSMALTCGILLALDASFIAYSRNDFAAVSTMMALKGAALWALLRWWQHADTKFLYAGCLLVGLGVTDRASFLWIPLAIFPTILFIYDKNLFGEIRRRLNTWKIFPKACLAFTIGASIFIAFNVATQGGTFTPMLSSFGSTSGGANNFAFFDNLLLRLRMLTEVLGGAYLNHFILGDLTYQTKSWNFAGSPLSWLAPLAFIYFIFKLAIDAFRNQKERESSRNPLLFIMLMNVFLLILSCFTPTLHRGHQLLILYPFPHLMVTLFVFEIAKHVCRLKRNVAPRMISIVAVLLIVIIAAAAGKPVLAYHRMLAQTGGRGVWSEAIYEIVAEVDSHPERAVVCMDWGFNANILALTRHPVKTIRNYYPGACRSPEQLAELFDDRHVFLFHSRQYTLMPEPGEDFSRALSHAGARVDTLRTFHQREGQPVAYLLSVRRRVSPSS